MLGSLLGFASQNSSNITYDSEPGIFFKCPLGRFWYYGRMFIPLKTSLPDLELVLPDVERDAAPSVAWLEGASGRETLALMGNTEADNRPSDLKTEQARIRSFLESTNQITWALRYHNQTVGAVWVSLEPTTYLPAPSVHIMIGDPAVRGKGLGSAALQAVISYLKTKYSLAYSRHLSTNSGSKKLLEKLGFEPMGPSYEDADGLKWQNLSRRL